MCVNEEDGLSFELVQTIDGSRELRLRWKDQNITDEPDRLEALLRAEPLWEVFYLQAVSTVQERVAMQM